MVDVYQERKRWISASLVAGPLQIDHFMVVIQSLGHKHIELLGRWNERQSRNDAELIDVENPFGSLSLMALMTDSVLWVFGAYELVRSIDQLASGDDWPFTARGADDINGLKRQLARVRVPLAKYQPAGKELPVGTVVPQFVLHESRGPASAVSSHEIVVRADLGEAMVSVLSGLVGAGR